MEKECPICQESSIAGRVECPICEGKGKMPIDYLNSKVCTSCNGSGLLLCNGCKGTGIVGEK